VEESRGDAPEPGLSARLECVGAVIKDRAGRLLLILRGHEPGKGLWSIPGGRIEAGETDEQAVIREVAEETGLTVTCGRLLGAAELPGQDGAVIEVRDYLAVLPPGATPPQAEAADDAAAVRWVSDTEADAMEARGELTPGLLAALRSWT
jgi:ADP-ribose pyrophosphatase YjhB (NUDIX family)